MPYLVVCPNCATKLKSPTPLAAGRSLNCPRCQGQFTLSEPSSGATVTLTVTGPIKKKGGGAFPFRFGR